MIHEREQRPARTHRGFSLIELLIVVAIIGILTVIALPQMIAQRRLMRCSALNREIATQLRLTRQLAMSERQAFTFQYNDATKSIRIIDHNNLRTDPNSGKAVLTAAGYPTTVGSSVYSTVPLTQGGIPASEITYGTPPLSPAVPTILGDLVPMTVTPVNGTLEITFQRDGSVIDNTGTATDRNPVDRALFIYNNKAPQGTASAISVLGASGRIKLWRYTTSGNTYVE